ncbi:MAG TPA: ABC transporter ATP-binding protein [Verrucomicrobiae bacterium]|nr:ABC transporter ATP-binding protein [Verrucomicrobiae bacterium]
MRVTLESVSKRYGPNCVVDRVSLDVGEGELVFLLGPSGCGKTTLLRMVAGFVDPEGGRVLFGGRPMEGVPPHKRNTAMVFQNYAVWPHMTVFENVAYGLRVRGIPEVALRKRVAGAIERVRLDGLERRRPGQLSGGQQQRVALARAIVVDPDVLLFDEPLSNLDARLRVEMREEIRRLFEDRRLTGIYVTHDQVEALSLADRIAVMREGRIEQTGTSSDVYDRPANEFVADFVGELNVLDGGSPLGEALGVSRGRRFGFRPERVRIGAGGVVGRIVSATFLGSRFDVVLEMGGARIKAWHGSAMRVGETARFDVPREHVLEFG